MIFPSLNPLLIVDGPKLFPNEVVYFGDQENVFEFAIESQLAAHNGLDTDLNDKSMECTMSILKRDNTTVYNNPEFVNFSLTYSFYEEYRGGLLRAHAEDILSDIEDAERLGDFFDKTWKVYRFFDNICSVISKTTGVVSTFTNALNGVSMILKASGVKSFLGITLSKLSMKTQGPLSWLFGTNPVIQKACGFVTCEHGGFITTNRLAKTKIGSKISKGFNKFENACVDLVSNPITPKKKTVERMINHKYKFWKVNLVLFLVLSMLLVIPLNMSSAFADDIKGGEVSSRTCKIPFNVKDSLVMSIVTLCIPGILEKAHELKNNKCQLVVCKYNAVLNDLDPAFCDKQDAYRNL